MCYKSGTFPILAGAEKSWNTCLSCSLKAHHPEGKEPNGYLPFKTSCLLSQAPVFGACLRTAGRLALVAVSFTGGNEGLAGALANKHPLGWPGPLPRGRGSSVSLPSGKWPVSAEEADLGSKTPSFKQQENILCSHKTKHKYVRRCCCTEPLAPGKAPCRQSGSAQRWPICLAPSSPFAAGSSLYVHPLAGCGTYPGGSWAFLPHTDRGSFTTLQLISPAQVGHPRACASLCINVGDADGQTGFTSGSFCLLS